MFERCDEDTTTIIDAGMTLARELGHNYHGTEHLLVTLSRHGDMYRRGWPSSFLHPTTFRHASCAT